MVFNLDQVNNLVSNGEVYNISNGDWAQVSCLTGGNTVGIGNSGRRLGRESRQRQR